MADYGQTTASAGMMKSGNPKSQVLADHLVAIKGEINELTNTLRAIADRTDGPHPQAVEDSDRASPPRYHMSDAQEIRKMLSGLREQVSRLDGVL